LHFIWILFLYTPIPWIAGMYVTAYRHDLTRIARPLRDHSSRKDWWSVCLYLGLISASVPKPKESPWKVTLFIVVIASSLISLVWLVITIPLAWYYLCALQAAAALPLFLLLVSVAGPIPFRPYRDVLPYPRLGTRVRHLKRRKTEGPSFAGGLASSSAPEKEGGGPR